MSPNNRKLLTEISNSKEHLNYAVSNKDEPFDGLKT